MASPEPLIVHLPPVGRLHRWTSAAPPSIEWLYNLLKRVDKLTCMMQRNQQLVELKPSPTPGALRNIHYDATMMQDIRSILYDLEYPSWLTSWVDTARTLADCVCNEMETFIGYVSELDVLLTETPPWKKSLTQARTSVRLALQQSNELLDHTKSLIEELEDSKNIVHPQAGILPFRQ